AHELRPGYLRADPRDRAAVERAIADAGSLVGTFDKPRFIHFEESLCAHSRSGITGCTRCLDLCPTAAITPNGNAVVIDENVCAGCGSCASACPTGAASYSLPSADALMRRLRTLLQTYRKAGGSEAIVLFHDGEHGEDIIDALARFGGVNLTVGGCTLCHACVTACPTGALSDNPDRAMLRFTESLCVQCGLCESTCPEKVISLEPRLDFKAWNAPLAVLKEEEP